jgi:hypothetical protein
MNGRRTRAALSAVISAQISASALPEPVNGGIWYQKV